MGMNGMKPPADLKSFYAQQEVAEPLTPEQEELKKLEEEEEAKQKAKDKKKKGKGKKAGKGKKKKGDDDEKPDVVMTGPSEVV